jgi:hypothetical protein
VLLAAGNITEKVPVVDVLSEPKSKAATAILPCELLYINAPLAVMVAAGHDASAKDKNAVVPVKVGVVDTVNVMPPAV